MMDIGLIKLINAALKDFVWGPYILTLLVGTGIYLSIRLGFPQFQHFAFAIKNTIGKLINKDAEVKGAMTPFQAVSTALASTVGTGNIAGVTGAIVLGGPGAVFWMWLSGIFGMCTKFCEVTLAIKHREKNKNGDWVGGPMYYIKNGLNPKMKIIGTLFAIFGALCAFGIGNLAQINSISSQAINVVNNFTGSNYTPYSGTGYGIALGIGIVIAIFAAFCLIGGISKIGAVTERMVPAMVVVYLLCAIIVVLVNIKNIPTVLYNIFYCAFNPEAITGGVVGITLMNCIRNGVARGVFSNEAGLGSAPMAHATSSETKPHKQGLYGIFEVFISTICICTLTALVVLTTVLPTDIIKEKTVKTEISTGLEENRIEEEWFEKHNVEMPGAKSAKSVVPGKIKFGDKSMADSKATALAFQSVFGAKAGSLILAVALLMFAASTILGWALYGVRCAEYLFGPKIIRPYEIFFCIVIVVGSVTELTLVWDIADTLNGLMAIPNLIALLLLSPWLASSTKQYFQKYDNYYEKRAIKADKEAAKAILEAEIAIIEAEKVTQMAQKTIKEAEKALQEDGDE